MLIAISFWQESIEVFQLMKRFLSAESEPPSLSQAPFHTHTQPAPESAWFSLGSENHRSKWQEVPSPWQLDPSVAPDVGYHVLCTTLVSHLGETLNNYWIQLGNRYILL